MGKIIAVANQKGGVGKSTTVVNLAAYFGSIGKKVLCIDMDAQGNTTTGFGISKKAAKSTTYEVLMGEARIADAAIKTTTKNVSLIASTADLAGGEVELVKMDNRASRLKMQVLTVKADYDYILIDCPPSLSLLTLNALCACDTVLIPMQCEFYALEGLSQLVETIKLVKMRYNPTLEMEGILFTMVDSRLNLTNQVVNDVNRHFPGKVFKTFIPRNVRLSEAPSYGIPVMYFDKNSKGTEAYNNLGAEIIKLQKKRK